MSCSSRFSPSRFNPQTTRPSSPPASLWLLDLPNGAPQGLEAVWQAHEYWSPPQVAVPDVVQAAADADILIFVVPHQFIGKICDQLKGHLKADTIGVSLLQVPETPSCGRGYSHLLWGSGLVK